MMNIGLYTHRKILSRTLSYTKCVFSYEYYFLHFWSPLPIY